MSNRSNLPKAWRSEKAICRAFLQMKGASPENTGALFFRESWFADYCTQSFKRSGKKDPEPWMSCNDVHEAISQDRWQRCKRNLDEDGKGKPGNFIYGMDQLLRRKLFRELYIGRIAWHYLRELQIRNAAGCDRDILNEMAFRHDLEAIGQAFAKGVVKSWKSEDDSDICHYLYSEWGKKHGWSVGDCDRIGMAVDAFIGELVDNQDDAYKSELCDCEAEDDWHVVIDAGEFAPGMGGAS